VVAEFIEQVHAAMDVSDRDYVAWVNLVVKVK
jgi:hypothetical protein